MILIFWRNPTELRLIFTLNFIYQFITITDKSRGILHFLQPPYLQIYADAAAGKGAPLYDCFDFANRTVLVFVELF